MPSVITPCGGGGGGGIKFVTYPQDGVWLYIKTTGHAGSPNGYGTEIEAADRLRIASTTDNLDIEAPQGQITLYSVSGTGSGNIVCDTDGSNDRVGLVFVDRLRDTGSGHWEIQRANHATIMYVNYDGSTEFYNPNGSYFAVYGNAGTALKIDNASSLVHMPNLPTSDPGITGVLWNDLGTVKVSL